MKNVTLWIGLTLLLCSCTSEPKKNTKPAVEIIQIEGLPILKGNLRHGGLNSLYFVKKENQILTFLSVTDRGPNAEVIQKNKKLLRPFLIPDYSPKAVEILYNEATHRATVGKILDLRKTKTLRLSGRPPQKMNTEIPVDSFGKNLPNDQDGVDSEGLCQFQNKFYVSEEYGPDLLEFNEDFVLNHRWTPAHGLPASYALRKENRGLEALACSSKGLFLMLQSPLQHTGAIVPAAFVVPHSSRLELTEYLYPLDSSKADKIGDATWIGENNFLVIEQNGKTDPAKAFRKIYRINLSQSNLPNTLKKELFLDISQSEISRFEKIEGISMPSDDLLVLIADNDFGLSGKVDFKTGQADLNKDPNSYIILIHMK